MQFDTISISLPPRDLRRTHEACLGILRTVRTRLAYMLYNNCRIIRYPVLMISCDCRAYSTPHFRVRRILGQAGGVLFHLRPQRRCDVICHIHLRPPLIVQDEDSVRITF